MPAISRNRFISSTIGAMAALPLRAYAQARPAPPLARVNVDPARVIRTVVGLRPFRRHGFVLRAEAFGSKTIVHNYGHGGGGFSLSWGCATLAADLLAARSPGRAAVIGCGVIGLSTARVLQDRGWEVTIYASSVPPNTTSNIAGAQWTPTVVFASQDATSEFLETFRRAARDCQPRFSVNGGPHLRRTLDRQLRPQACGHGTRRTRLRRFGRHRGPLSRHRNDRPRLHAVRRPASPAVHDDADRAKHVPPGRHARFSPARRQDRSANVRDATSDARPGGARRSQLHGPRRARPLQRRRARFRCAGSSRCSSRRPT